MVVLLSTNSQEIEQDHIRFNPMQLIKLPLIILYQTILVNLVPFLKKTTTRKTVSTRYVKKFLGLTMNENGTVIRVEEEQLLF